jgi:hypothetical protein
MNHKDINKERKRLMELPFSEQLFLAGITKAELSRQTGRYPSTISNWGDKAPQEISWGLANHILLNKLL